MAPMTALRMMDIDSNAARLLPKPMLPNAAKITRMLIRRQKRTSTWVDLSSRGRFGSCAKIRNSDGGALRGPQGPNAGMGLSRLRIRSFVVLREIVAADRLVERVRVARHNGDAACPARRCTDALGIDERAQDRQRQIRVTGFDRSIEPVRELALARQRAIPLALVIGDAANLPLRQFQVDQRKRRIGPGSRFNQAFDPRRLFGLSDRRKTPAGRADDFGYELCRHRMRVTQPITEFDGV